MDLATIIGMVAAFGVVAAAIFMGGSFGVFVNAPSMMIVIGGAVSATVLRFPINEVATALITGGKIAFTNHKTSPRALLEELRKLADVSRTQGPIGLESVEVSDPFLARGKQMIADG
ncbi:MAG: flagellar motor protein PomA, partial [Pseudomonadota bacterium]